MIKSRQIRRATVSASLRLTASLRIKSAAPVRAALSSELLLNGKSPDALLGLWDNGFGWNNEESWNNI